MRDSINRTRNRKAQRRKKRSTMAAPSDDRNGVVVNRAMEVHAIDSTRGLPKQLVEERCIKCENRVRKFMRKVSTRSRALPRSATSTLVR